MNEIIFSDDDINNLDKIAEKLFINIDENNPASIHYKRHLERPTINWFHIALHIIIPITLVILIINILLQMEIGLSFSIMTSCSMLLIYIVLSLKKILICSVRIYQRLAPDSIRMKCRFEPSCSQYMLLSLEKYGAYKGLLIGIKRLRRCKIGNGGYDFL